MRPNLSEDIHSLSEFKRNTAAMVKRIKRTKRPLILTVNGKAVLVVRDIVEYERSLAQLEYQETIAAIRESLADAEAGRVVTADEFLPRLKEKLRRYNS